MRRWRLPVVASAIRAVGRGRGRAAAAATAALFSCRGPRRRRAGVVFAVVADAFVVAVFRSESVASSVTIFDEALGTLILIVLVSIVLFVTINKF